MVVYHEAFVNFCKGKIGLAESRAAVSYVERNKAAAVIAKRIDKDLVLVDKSVRNALFVGQNGLPLGITEKAFYPHPQSRRTVTRNVRVVAAARRVMVARELQRRGVDSWTVGFDGSTSRNMVVVQTINVFYLDDAFHFNHHALGVVETHARKGSNIADATTTVLERTGGGDIVLAGSVHDGASAECLAGRLLGGEMPDTSVICNAHTA
jgi:hypothetical protein